MGQFQAGSRAYLRASEKLLELIACLMEAEGDQVLDEGLGPLYLSG